MRSNIAMAKPFQGVYSVHLFFEIYECVYMRDGRSNNMLCVYAALGYRVSRVVQTSDTNVRPLCSAEQHEQEFDT